MHNPGPGINIIIKTQIFIVPNMALHWLGNAVLVTQLTLVNMLLQSSKRINPIQYIPFSLTLGKDLGPNSIKKSGSLFLGCLKSAYMPVKI